ncbi:MAG: hypothetical protein POH28_03300 [Acidocella sp.]|nr:hypothetical protein [Acidocella sp.]
MSKTLSPRLCTRLDRLAAAAEAEWQDVLRRQQTALESCTPQQQLLTAYRARLGGSWRAGTVISAGEAQRAALFSTASQDASRQIAAAAARATTQIESAREALAALRAQRRMLAEALRAARRQSLNTHENR